MILVSHTLRLISFHLRTVYPVFDSKNEATIATQLLHARLPQQIHPAIDCSTRVNTSYRTVRWFRARACSSGSPREKRIRASLCVATDALKNARVRDTNDTGGHRREQRIKRARVVTSVSLIVDASRTAPRNSAFRCSRAPPTRRLMYALPLSLDPRQPETPVHAPSGTGITLVTEELL